MRKVLQASVIYRWLTAAAAFFDRQWQKSRLSVIVAGAPEKTGEFTVFHYPARFLHMVISRVFAAIRLDKALKGSMFTYPFFWCALTAASAPILPTMVTLALAVVSAVSVLVSFGLDKDKRLFYSPVNKWIYLFSLVYFVSTFTSVTVAASLKGGLLTCAFVLFSIALQNSVTKRSQINTLIYLFVAAGLAVSVYGFLQVVLGVESTTDWIDEDTFSSLKLRVYSTLANPNVLAEYLLLIIPLGAVSVVTAKTINGKLAAGVSTGAMIICMVLTYSRGGWLGLIFSAAVFLVLVDRRFIVIGLVGMVALIFVLPQSVLSRFASIGDMTDSSTSYRFSIWMGTVGMLKDYWFCGVGPGTAAFTKIYPIYSYSAATSQHAHSLYLQILSETGICGGFAFFGYIISLLRQLASAMARTKDRVTRLQLTAVMSGMAGFLLQSATDHSFYNYRVTLTFWAVGALGTLLCRTWPEEGGDTQ